MSLPAWITELLRPTPTPTGPSATRLRQGTGDPWAPTTRREKYLTAAIDRETTRVREAVVGGRNHALFIAACALGQLVAGGELDADYVRAVLLDASAAHVTDPDYPRAQAARTITSGLRRGATRPRRLSEAA